MIVYHRANRIKVNTKTLQKSEQGRLHQGIPIPYPMFRAHTYNRRKQPDGDMRNHAALREFFLQLAVILFTPPEGLRFRHTALELP